MDKRELNIKGCSERNLASFRTFHLTYLGILQAVPAKSSGTNRIQQAPLIKSSEIAQALPAQSFQLVGNGEVGEECRGWGECDDRVWDFPWFRYGCVNF